MATKSKTISKLDKILKDQTMKKFILLARRLSLSL